MAHISFTKNAAEKLNIDITNYIEGQLIPPGVDDWIIDTVWKRKLDPWIIFYHIPSTFTIFLQPKDYKLENCINQFLSLLTKLLNKNDLRDKVPYFIKLFKDIILCKNYDHSSLAHMARNKITAYSGLKNPVPKYRVTSLYELMILVNSMPKKKFNMKSMPIEVFVDMAKCIPIEEALSH